MSFAWDASVRVVGHRGSPQDATENTLASFLKAVEAGADAVELDVHLSADGVPIVHHDPDLGRTVGGEGPVGERTAAELAALGVPTLADVLRAVPLPIDVELKVDGLRAEELPAAVAEVVRRAGALDRVLATSFDPFLASAYAELAGRPAGWVAFYPVTPEEAADFPRLEHVLLAHEAATEEVVTALRAKGRVVHAWTVNDAEEARRLVARGVSGVITDRPAALLAALGRRGGAAR